MAAIQLAQASRAPKRLPECRLNTSLAKLAREVFWDVMNLVSAYKLHRLRGSHCPFKLVLNVVPQNFLVLETDLAQRMQKGQMRARLKRCLCELLVYVLQCMEEMTVH